VTVVARSRWYRSAPYGYVHQPKFLNGVVMVETALAPVPLLETCHEIERAAGRRRGVRWGPRSLDLDLIAYDRVCIAPRGRAPLSLPHPGLRSRPFVLVPLREIAPHWRHPLTGETPGEMLRKLGPRAAGSVLGLAD
jgi:2-amino-4-hydroxy-6-hydroxymethyldihydropteridine diphosphokinase